MFTAASISLFRFIQMDRYSRLLSAKYGDGFSSPTTSITGGELPNARLISLIVFGEEDVPDPQFTLVNMQWGQIITHDMSMIAGTTQASNLSKRRNKSMTFCKFSPTKMPLIII